MTKLLCESNYNVLQDEFDGIFCICLSVCVGVCGFAWICVCVCVCIYHCLTKHNNVLHQFYNFKNKCVKLSLYNSLYIPILCNNSRYFAIFDTQSVSTATGTKRYLEISSRYSTISTK